MPFSTLLACTFVLTDQTLLKGLIRLSSLSRFEVKAAVTNKIGTSQTESAI
jgi:hypothetical protein